MKVFNYAAAVLLASSSALAYKTYEYQHYEQECVAEKTCDGTVYPEVPDYPETRPDCNCHDNEMAIKLTGEGTVNAYGVTYGATDGGIDQFRIEKPMILADSGDVCGTISTVHTSTSYEQFLQESDVMCLDACNNEVWFSGKITHQSSDPRLSLVENAVNQAAVRLGRGFMVGKMIDHGQGGSERSDFISLKYGAFEGLDNAVLPLGTVGISRGDTLIGYDARDICKLRDEALTQYIAHFKLVCTSDCAEDCELPLTDYNSPNGLYMPDFRRFVRNTAIQWLDENGNACGEPVANTVANLSDPPEHVRICHHTVDMETFTYGDICLVNLTGDYY